MVAVNAAKSLANFLCPMVAQEGHIIKSFAMQPCQTLVIFLCMDRLSRGVNLRKELPRNTSLLVKLNPHNNMIQKQKSKISLGSACTR